MAGVKPCIQDPPYKQQSNRQGLYTPQNAEEIRTQLPGTIAQLFNKCMEEKTWPWVTKNGWAEIGRRNGIENQS